MRVDGHLEDGIDEGDVDRWVRSACVLCSYGCGMEIAVEGERIVGVRGRGDDHVNHGRLGPKGLFGWQAVNAADRLRTPLLRRGGDLEPTDWDTAMASDRRSFAAPFATRGPSAFGFYTSGQLFLEEYYTLAMLARAGIGTAHLDGNTRMCTATADAALKESFGADGNPGCYEDLDVCDTVFLVGHNMPETQTVMWARILDRLRGPERPRLVVVDPRRTAAASEADVHLSIRGGHEPSAAVRDPAASLSSTVGSTSGSWTPHRRPGGAGGRGRELDPRPRRGHLWRRADEIRRAAEIIGTAERLVSTVLQGVYQAHQAAASAIQVNNIHLLRGMIGKPGATVFQMNGQPTAQNTRETGANGDFPGDAELGEPGPRRRARASVERGRPVDPPLGAVNARDADHPLRRGRIDRIAVDLGDEPGGVVAGSRPHPGDLRQEDLFLIVQDAFLTETAMLADVVLPTALGREDRNLHERRSDGASGRSAVLPPGEARADLDIFLDYAARMDFRNKDGDPLIGWTTPEGAFDAFKTISAGRPADYSAMSYPVLRERGWMQWPCSPAAPEGTQRLYTDHTFPTWTDYTEDYGHDLLTGAPREEAEHRSLRAEGRAFLRAAEWVPPVEPPGDAFPLRLATGRTVHHWHTRTKTGRVPELQAAAPHVWVELHEDDAAQLGIVAGDRCRVVSPRGQIEGEARLGRPRRGQVFVPFHYGYWDLGDAGPSGGGRAANELTITAWDPVSKQPLFKTAAVRVEKVT